MGMAVLGLDGQWITVNSALPRHHRPRRQRSSTRLSLLDLVHPTTTATTSPRRSRRCSTARLQTCESEIRTGHRDRRRGLGRAQHARWFATPSGAPSYFVLQVVDISDRIRAQEKLARRAVTDPLTGLPNRLVLHDRLEHALARCRREGTQVGLVFIDLDHFKSLNDVFGHDAGDEVLRQVSARLSAAVRDGDTAVRLGGDEFVVLCERERRAAPTCRRSPTRLLAELSRPYDLAWGQASISCSFGLTVGSGPDATTLVHQADAAMYRSKQQGRSRINVFDQAAQAVALHDLALETELVRALHEGELRIHYQPIVRLSDGTVQAREALVRWQHPTRGLLEPAAFMGVAEQSRLITELGQWMLAQACRDAADLDRRRAVCVNISPRHLAAVRLPGVGRADSRRGRVCLPAGFRSRSPRVSILQASTSTLTRLAGLTDLGVTLALDDFGTGYSSITALHRLPITTSRSTVRSSAACRTTPTRVHSSRPAADGRRARASTSSPRASRRPSRRSGCASSAARCAGLPLRPAGRAGTMAGRSGEPRTASRSSAGASVGRASASSSQRRERRRTTYGRPRKSSTRSAASLRAARARGSRRGSGAPCRRRTGRRGRTPTSGPSR